MVQIVSNMLCGDRGAVVYGGRGQEGEALAVWEGAGMVASVPDVEGGAGEEENLFSDLVADAVRRVTRHECLLRMKGGCGRTREEVVKHGSDGYVVSTVQQPGK